MFEGLIGDNPWLEVPDGDDRARAIFKRHYSWHEYRDGRPHLIFVGPGEKMVLITKECDALFIWRKFRSDDGQEGVNCAAFRNESNHLSSDLIKQAVELARVRWPNKRFYTYVNPKKIRSENPGTCFIKAGWQKCGVTKAKKLQILELIPSRKGEDDGEKMY
jgi:hypothetical protein